jgi:hypothetical protein
MLTFGLRVEDLELPLVHPRMAFITGAIDKEIRLSFAQRIRGTLPDPYQELITEGKEKDTPGFKYSSDSEFPVHMTSVYACSIGLANILILQLLLTPKKAEKSCNSFAKKRPMRRSSR